MEIYNIPCKKCLTQSMCKSNRNIDCDILYDWCKDCAPITGHTIIRKFFMDEQYSYIYIWLTIYEKGLPRKSLNIFKMLK